MDAYFFQAFYDLAQSFRLLFDTASSYLWVLDKSYRQPTCLGGHPCAFKKRVFDAGQSSTYKNLSRTVALTYYGLGTADGAVGEDVINVSPISNRNSRENILQQIFHKFTICREFRKNIANNSLTNCEITRKILKV